MNFRRRNGSGRNVGRSNNRTVFCLKPLLGGTVHLWVEDFLELFTTIMVACIFVLLGVVRERVALTMVYLDMLLYSAGGMIGTMHHVYFSGEPAVHMARGHFSLLPK